MSALDRRGTWTKPRHDIHIGDVVVCRLTVRGLSGQEICVEVPSLGGSGVVPMTRACVVEHVPQQRPLCTGDTVIAPGNGEGVIRAIVDGLAWVRFAPTILAQYSLSDLSLVTA